MPGVGGPRVRRRHGGLGERKGGEGWVRGANRGASGGGRARRCRCRNAGRGARARRGRRAHLVVERSAGPREVRLSLGAEVEEFGRVFRAGGSRPGAVGRPATGLARPHDVVRLSRLRSSRRVISDGKPPVRSARGRDGGAGRSSPRRSKCPSRVRATPNRRVERRNRRASRRAGECGRGDAVDRPACRPSTGVT